MSNPCKNCGRPYPTAEFIGEDGICIICTRQKEKANEILAKIAEVRAVQATRAI